MRYKVRQIYATQDASALIRELVAHVRQRTGIDLVIDRASKTYASAETKQGIDDARFIAKVTHGWLRYQGYKRTEVDDWEEGTEDWKYQDGEGGEAFIHLDEIPPDESVLVSIW